MNVLDLFSGIGGFSLGLERAGMRTVAFCEIDPYCRKVLAKHWPTVPCYGDIRELTAARLASDGIAADLICGGFPCQNISIAGDGAGLVGEHSGLWQEFYRLLCELRPRFALVENVSAICSRGLRELVGQLSDVGYDAEWEGIPAAAIGAVHLRAREWVLAYPPGFGNRPQTQTILPRRLASERGDWWATEPAICRVDDGLPFQVDRLRCLGNAIVPQIAEIIGKAIMNLEQP